MDGFDGSQPVTALSVTPSTPTRVLGTAFQPSLTKAVLCNYGIFQQVQSIILTAGNVKTELLCDAANPPTTVQTSAQLSVSGVAATVGNTSTISFIVPAGWYVLLKTTNISGASNTQVLASQNEEAFN